MKVMRDRQANQGFTLIELLVVIGIFVLLAVVAFPFVTGVEEGNKMMGCQSNMQAIYRALKMYHLDMHGYPGPLKTVCWACNPPTVTDHWVDKCPVCGETDKLEYVGGLHALVNGGYLDLQSLVCPSSPYDREQAVYTTSYEDEDPDADKGNGAYKFLPNRISWSEAGGLSTTDSVEGRDVPIYFRQLAPDPKAPAPWNGRGITWNADESTVVTWCNYHAGLIRRDGKDQYLVLFLDGRVQMQDMDRIAGSDALIDETWRATPVPEP